MCKVKLPGCLISSSTIHEVISDDYLALVKQPNYKLTEQDFKKIYLLKRLIKNNE